MRPLHLDASDARRTPSSHAGLWYDRFFNCYDANWTVPADNENAQPAVRGKKAWIKTVTSSAVGDQDKLAAFAVRQQSLISALAGINRVFATDWHFVTGMGNNHPVENGFAWHPTLGVPYLTGAAAKGLSRGWCEAWCDFDEDKIRLWFGDTDKAGELIFFDAVPTGPVKLKVDIMTPHYGDWYAKGNENRQADGSNVPADWHDPVPVPFLVVDKGAAFQFSVARRATKEAESIDLDEVMGELVKALEWLGAGAKTAAGYGRMVEDPKEKEANERAERRKAEAEAEQQRQIEAQRAEEQRQIEAQRAEQQRQIEAQRAEEQRQIEAQRAEEQRRQELAAMPEHERVLAEASHALEALVPRLILYNTAYGELRGIINSVLDSIGKWGEQERGAAINWVSSVLDQHGWRHPDFNAPKKKKWENKMRQRLEELSK